MLRYLALFTIAATTLLVPATGVPITDKLDGVLGAADWADCAHDAYAYAGGPSPSSDMEYVRARGGDGGVGKRGTSYATGTGWAQASSGSGFSCNTA